MPIPSVFDSPTHGVTARHTRNTLLAAVRNVVAVVVGERTVVALPVVNDAIGVAVCGPFDHARRFNSHVCVDPPAPSTLR